MAADSQINYATDLGEPSQETLEWAKNNINENPDTKCQIISDLRDIIYSRGECIPDRTDDAFLLKFLRARNFSLESAYKLVVNYCYFREENPQYFKGFNFDFMEKMGEDDIFSIPPYTEATGRRMLIFRVEQWSPEKYTVDDLFKGLLTILEMAALEQFTQILGGICIVDLNRLSMQQAWHLTPSVANKLMQIVLTSFPLKIHAVHIINQTYAFDVIFNVIKPFMNDRMKERIFFHGEDIESLHSRIDPRYLPKRYGGTNGDYDNRVWIEHIKENEDLVKELESLGLTDI